MEEQTMAQFLENMKETFNDKMKEVKEEFNKQTTNLMEKFTANVALTIEEKLKPLVQENANLKKEVTTLKNKISNLERETKKNNIILHGIEDKEESQYELLDVVIKFLNETGKGRMDEFDKWEISDARRLGKKVDGKKRPILVKLTLAWRKVEILKNNKNFPENTYATEDFPKEILKIRKELEQKRKAEIEKGNRAFILYDKLIIKPQEKEKEKRKRSPTNSPVNLNDNNNDNTKRGLEAPNKINKTNAFEHLQRYRKNSTNKQ